MQLGFFTMPIHPLGKDWRQSLREDREAYILADELGFAEAYCGEHATDQAENITSCAIFLATLVDATKRIRLGTGTINMPNTHPVAVAAQLAMLDHLLDGRFIFGISPGGLLSDAEAHGNLDKDLRPPGDLGHAGQGCRPASGIPCGGGRFRHPALRSTPARIGPTANSAAAR